MQTPSAYSPYFDACARLSGEPSTAHRAAAVAALRDSYQAIETFSGVMFSLTNPTPEMVVFEDIETALDQLPRFNGHNRSHYSIARHSVLVHNILNFKGFDEATRVHGLVHDFGEAYVGDVTSPMKRLLQPFFGIIEEGIMAAVFERFNIAPPTPEILEAVRMADLLAMGIERRMLRPNSGHDWWFPATYWEEVDAHLGLFGSAQGESLRGLMLLYKLI